MAYSFIGFQTAYIATRWNPIYWDTACLVVNSGSLEDDENDYEEDEDGDIIDVKKKEATTDYTKLAKAIGEITDNRIKISLVDINRSSYGFEPDVKNNQILFGMKALSGINAPTIDEIIENRPYRSLKEFLNKCSDLKKPQVITLIKSGAFDNFDYGEVKDSRRAAMIYYISQIYDKKSRLTLQNVNGLIEHNLILKEFSKEKNIFILNKQLKKSFKNNNYYNTGDTGILEKLCKEDDLEVINGVVCIQKNKWEAFYKSSMEKIKDWLKKNQDQVLNEYNWLLFKEMWDKYAEGSISKWEMDSVCFYYHEHELAHMNNGKYGVVDFDSLSRTSDIERVWKNVPIYNLHRIAGTVIAKNDARHSVSLLTTSGVVNVKFSKDYYARLNRQISELGEDGKKHIQEKGWLTRGTKLLVTGYRTEDTFRSKVYRSKGGHQVYLIENVYPNGNVDLRHNRYGEKD